MSDQLIASTVGSGRFQRVVIFGMTIFVILVVLLSILVLKQTKENIKEDIQNNLVTVLSATERQQESWLEDQRILLREIANDSELLLIAHRLNVIQKDRDKLLNSQVLKYARGYFKRKSDLLGVRGFFVIDPHGISLASSRDSNTGTKNLIVIHFPKLFQRVLDGETIFFPPMPTDIDYSDRRHGATMFVGTPI
ncbi:MAG: cache domain-containing protein, partial [Chromatiales bacterium]|nr:cache domain-containing protein [Chromatiales bacterium]